MYYRIDQNTLREKIIDKVSYAEELNLYIKKLVLKILITCTIVPN